MTATVLAAAAALVVPAAASATPVPVCGGWTSSVLRSGMGTLENLAFDGAGAVYVSKQNAVTGRGQVLRGRSPATLASLADLPNPGGLVIRDGRVFVTTANSAPSGLFGATDGTVAELDPGTASVRTWAAGLTMPNGLAALPDGRFVTSTVLGPKQGTVVSARGGVPTSFALRGESVNGLWFDGASGRLWASTATSAQTGLYAIDPARPAAPRRYAVPGLGPANFADDLTVGPDGAVYATLDLPGKVVRLDPETGALCTIDAGHRGVTSVRFGRGTGWDPRSLYATTLGGKLLRLTP
ncbi:SMP-30/Gluconolaconase/LRE domain protein OS=Tsukamurella paurometabola (strain ATCC 8368 / DSM/ CCUG 35730 / CIP 100753 / JCM 10117 / KCTC 9821 / NBRC 16120 / NCIMB 702349 / NCTC 13040) OX=521096 GN=Tpau_0422 PE=4 SV=1 [Tsukamurella paurometabola]|uniref:SMP-30/Gluconolaconase/LRE domain protein n=1 Tax=Tsukamurella paurometabola (strain ATCC 8368 / DSM 20162 / CCUG 35730 / CIP 100753 / JCM 10117 / KCTC 9821 / NBRC 16120 / NCIMB 702349 / NCTC 13040) TaxID=521096 RepID=D5URL0_TSUPD|nr:SMP-30/gluconolaconase/LRE domain-containing protein [Tsukamurella paurometabola]ADG77063.1 SMP-30/Gluconolaconase/LRE domain protein [Tsukamurella paurometabola DSM 20162]SUP42645.1 Streptogramin lyase [Tsukamurella paurometabola]